MPLQPGVFSKFNGLWARGSRSSTPPDHFVDCLNVAFKKGVNTREGTTVYRSDTGIIKQFIYKPNPPFAGTNVPRIIALKEDGDLVDLLLGATIYSNAGMKSVGFVNFFGRAYISPGDGKTGAGGVNIKVYKGDGNPARDIGGIAPTVALTAAASATPGGMNVGTYLFSYAWETDTGFITKPAPFAGVEVFSATGSVDLSNIGIGPAGTVARWIISTKVHPLTSLGPLGGPWDVGRGEFLPTFFVMRVPNNTATVQHVGKYDEALVEAADYLWRLMPNVPAGLGLVDYNGRLVSYGEYADPSLVRVSQPGDIEAFSATSGFLITDPTDSGAVKNATEFRGSFYIFKETRGSITEDNYEEASTWKLTNFEKAQGTDHQGIAAILDAKGSSADGFVIASKGALNYFNGTFTEPELSYKIRDYWARINKNAFNLVQVVNDPINRKLYILLPLDESPTINYLLYGDYRDGLSASEIKWSPWKFTNNPTSIVVYSDFTAGVASLKTRISSLVNILDLNDVATNDAGTPIDSYFQLPFIRFGLGVNTFGEFYLSGKGPATLEFTAFGQDEGISVNPNSLTLAALPGREYSQLMNLVSEQCSLKVRSNLLDKKFEIDFIKIEGKVTWKMRPRI